MRIIIITLADTPIIEVPDIATADQIDMMIKRKYGVQLADGKAHDWLMCVVPNRKNIQPKGDALSV